MKQLKVKGIVISENNMGDFDKMLTILTPNLGKIGCSARGARRPKSLLLSGTQFLCFGDYMLFKGSDTYTMNSCETIELFYNIRTDLDKLKYAIHITKIIQDVITENQNCYKIIQLFLNTLYTISETDKNLDLTISIFKLRLMCYLGFTPIINKCVSCEEKENITHFSIKDNGFKCEACSRIDKSSIQITKSTENAIKYIVTAPPKKLFSFNLKDESLEELKLITQLFVNNNLEKEYKIEEF